MKIAIVQSCYIPWRGYFDLIHDVDVFVFLDNVQMTMRDWRTRNFIKSPRGPKLLTIPVLGGRHQRICDVRIAQEPWQRKHHAAIMNNYAHAPFLHSFDSLLDWMYLQPHAMLSDFNQETTRRLCEILGIRTPLLASANFNVTDQKVQRLIDICRDLGADEYVSGPNAKGYLDLERFRSAGISVQFKEYPDYPVYPQAHPPYEPRVSILDLLFSVGPAAADFIWSAK